MPSFSLVFVELRQFINNVLLYDTRRLRVVRCVKINVVIKSQCLYKYIEVYML